MASKSQLYLPLLLLVCTYQSVASAESQIIIECKEAHYASRLSELNKNYSECARKYSEYMAANPDGPGSISSCGNIALFGQQAQAYADEKCARRERINREAGQALSPSCVPIPGVLECPPSQAESGDESTLATSPRPQRRPVAEQGQAQSQATQSTTPQEPGAAQSEVQADLNACMSSQSNATRCCGNPQSCAGSLPANDQRNLQQLLSGVSQGPQEGQSLAQYCSQMRSATNSGASINTYLSRICYGQMSSCTSTCGSLTKKYQALAANCSGCASQQIYNDAHKQLSSYNSTCSQLSGQANALAAQSGANSLSGGYASACGNMTGAIPQGLAGQDPSGQNSLQVCLQNPNVPGCEQVLRANESNARTGQASFESRKAEEKTEFNLPDLGDMQTALGPAPTNNNPGSPAASKTVPNNSGGGIPGSGGGGSAQLGGGPSKGSPGSPGYNTDVLQGTSSGSGYSSQSFGNSQTDPNGRWIASNSAINNDPNNKLLGVDLKKYLPGGDLDPQRRFGGAGSRSQINPKEENIWRIISNKFDEKCRLGVLWHCEPDYAK